MKLCRFFLSWLLVLCAVFVLASPSPAFAQDEKARARELFAAGVERYSAGDYRGALNAFESAYRLAPHHAVRVNMANCFEQLGRPTEAVFNFRRFLEEAGDGIDEAQREEVEKTIARLEAKIGTLVVTLEPSDASLRIDGTVPRLTPEGAVRLGEGRYAISVSAPGYVTEEQEVIVSGGMEQRLDFSLERDRAQLSGSEPATVVTEQEELIEPPQEADGIEQESRSSPLLWIAAGTTATLAVGFAVTGGLAIKSQNEFDDAVERSNDPFLSQDERASARADGLDASDRAETLALVSDLMLAGSVVAGGATLLIWLTDKKRDDKTTALRAGPLLLRRGQGGGFVVGGKF